MTIWDPIKTVSEHWKRLWLELHDDHRTELNSALSATPKRVAIHSPEVDDNLPAGSLEQRLPAQSRRDLRAPQAPGKAFQAGVYDDVWQFHYVLPCLTGRPVKLPDAERTYARAAPLPRLMIALDFGTTDTGISWSSSQWGTGQNSYDDAYLGRQLLDRLGNHCICVLVSSKSNCYQDLIAYVLREGFYWFDFPCRGSHGPSSGHYYEVPGRNHSGWGGIAASNGSNIYGSVRRVNSSLRLKSGLSLKHDG